MLIYVNLFPELVHTARIQPAVALMNVIRVKFKQHEGVLNDNMFRLKIDGALQEIGSEGIRQVVWSSLTLHLS